ncbi:AfsR/SARP family transcriptional regulator [Plantactinospora mayteni]|uniref:AfsR/SARP family transcriptional regulator n=1 Tax=Plantactinospora mayteni TaxID=566021 RepID=UPI001941A967|nr:AfsR/SARP family transcriptional regulator [Plantactinospora mayteni]
MRPESERARGLLAALAWQPGQFVSDETAIRQIWGDELPQHPRDSLYTCANRLRQAFSRADPAAAESPVRRERGGYLLAIEPSVVDLHRFRCSLHRARSAARLGDDATAIELFDHALALWQTVPLPDLGSDWAARARTQLQHEYSSARIGRAATGLRLGRHVEDTPELYGLAREHPLDERVAGLLMTALYRGGRRQDALDHYADVRSRLVGELGTDPGAELRDLQARILRHEPLPDGREPLMVFA